MEILNVLNLTQVHNIHLTTQSSVKKTKNIKLNQRSWALESPIRVYIIRKPVLIGYTLVFTTKCF